MKISHAIWKNKKVRNGLVLVGLLVVYAVLFLLVRGVIPVTDSVQIGPVSVRFYSLFVFLAFVAVIAVCNHLRKAYPDLVRIDIWEALFYILIPGIIGARIYHVLTDYQLYLENPIQMFAIWSGGLGIIGGIVGGAAGAAFYAWRKKLSATLILGGLAVAVPLGQAIGRLGNLFNYELYGLPLDAPWALYVPPQHRFWLLSNYEYYHPLFLYESIGCLVIFLLLYILWWKKVRPVKLVLLYLGLYGTIRYILDFLRLEGRNGVYFLSYAQWLILISVILVLLFAIASQVRYRVKFGTWYTGKEKGVK